MSSDEKTSKAPLAIGPLLLQGRAILAPMSGVTDVGFRRASERFGAGLVVSEMVASEEFVRGSRDTAVRAEATGVGPHVVQLAGCEAHWMAEAAKLAEGAGADVIDINMGCPAKKVTGGWSGSALMRDLDHALSLIEAVVGAVSVPVSVKMRLGWDATCLNAPDLARRAQEAGVALVTVHGRTRQQFYKGQADWAAIAAVKQAVTIPVVANGDIGSLADAQTCLKASQADAVMIGREALGRPWLIGAIARGLEGDVWQEPSPETKAQAAIEHYETLLVLFGMEAGVRHARKHLAAYADHAGGLDPVRRARLVTSQKPEEVMALLRASFLNKAQTLECAA